MRLFTIALLLFLAGNTINTQAQPWIQIGQDIDGEAADDWSGYSVSLSTDGNTVAIGAPGNGIGFNSGHVRVYHNVGGSWSQIGQDLEGEAAGDLNGSSVSLSADGNTVAIGARGNDGNGSSYSGHVRVYQNAGGFWSQIGQDIDAEAAGDRSGSSLSLSSDGTTVAIGAPYSDGNGTNAGHVRVYQNVGGSWSQIGQDIDGEAANDRSGRSVSISADGNTVAIGAYKNDGNGTSSGHVRVYQNVGGSWSQIGQDIDGEAAYDWSGHSVSLSADGNTVASGAWRNGENDSTGHVRVYQNVGGSWSQIGQDIDGEAAYDFSGWSVSLSADGNTVAIGAIGNGYGFNSGHVRVYQNVGGSWSQIGQDIDGEAADDRSGFSVSLSADGNTVAIGAPFNYENDSTGYVRVYELGCGPVTFLPNILGEININPLTSYSYVISQPPSGFTIDWAVINGALTSGQGTTVANVFWDANGYGQVVVTLSDGVCPISDTLVVGHPPVSIFDLLSEETNISPNPSSGIYQVQGTGTLSVHNALGDLILRKNISGNSTIDLSTQANGIYTLQLQTEKGTLTRKLIKE
ncbi:MAG: hypothetical protein ACI85F_001386 [Bacteroidia bacterium]|jgi:hypothetical protein